MTSSNTNSKFDIDKAKIKFFKDKTRFCDTKEIHKNILEYMNKNDYLIILGRPVWVVPHDYVKDKIAIRPFGLIFISDHVPKKFFEVIVYHEKVEEQYELDGSDSPHERALEKEYQFLKETKLYNEFMNWLKDFSPFAYNQRVDKWNDHFQ